MNLKIKAVATILAESVPSLQEKYVTVLTAVEKRSEQTYAKLLKKRNLVLSLQRMNGNGLVN